MRRAAGRKEASFSRHSRGGGRGRTISADRGVLGPDLGQAGGRAGGGHVASGAGSGLGGVCWARMPAAVCARQTALAFAHYHDAVANPGKWSSLSWDEIAEMPLNVRLPMAG